MNQGLERLLPLLSTIPGVNIPVTVLQGFYIAASQSKIEEFEQALRYEVNLWNQKFEANKLLLAKDYVKTENFSANIIQAFRAAEVAESKQKLKFIARALLGCATDFSPHEINRSLCMRIVEQITTDEIDFIAEIVRDGRFNRTFDDIFSNKPFMETSENTVLARGLIQLGLLVSHSGPELSIRLQPSALAENLVLLCRQTEL